MILNGCNSSNFNSYGLELGCLGRAFNFLKDEPKKGKNVKSDIRVVFSFHITYSSNFLKVSSKYLKSFYQLIPKFSRILLKIYANFPQVIPKFIQNSPKNNCFFFKILLILSKNSLQFFSNFHRISLEIF